MQCSQSRPLPIQISHSGTGAHEAALVAFGGGAAVAWHDRRDGNAEIYLRLLDRHVRPSSAELRLTDTSEESYEPSLAAIGDAIGIAWYDKHADGTLTAKLGLWAADGSPRWTTAMASPSRNPVLRAHGRALVAVWIQGSGEAESVWLGRWNDDGSIAEPPRELAPAHETTWNLNAAVDPTGTAWVIFDALSRTARSEVFFVRADRDTVSTTRLTGDDGSDSKYPDIAMQNGRVAVTWFDAKDGNTEVYLWAGTEGEIADGIERRARRVTSTRGESIGAYVAWNGERIGLAWCDDTDGQNEVYFQAFDPRGRPVSDTVRVTNTRTASLIPSIQPWRDGFALAWNEYEPAPAGHTGQSEIFAVATGGR